MNERKLRLNKETIRNLSDESLDQVAGGRGKTIVVTISGANSGCVNVSCKDCDSLIIIGTNCKG